MDYGSFGYGSNLINIGPGFTAMKWNNITAPSFYLGSGGTAQYPFSTYSWEGIWGNVFTGDAPQRALFQIYCKPAPINCDGFNTAYNFWQLPPDRCWSDFHSPLHPL